MKIFDDGLKRQVIDLVHPKLTAIKEHIEGVTHLYSSASVEVEALDF